MNDNLRMTLSLRLTPDFRDHITPATPASIVVIKSREPTLKRPPRLTNHHERPDMH